MRDHHTSLVMTGKLEDFRLADVLQVVGLSRQYTAVELRRGDGKVHGTIYVKAGRVVAAERDGVHGRAAFYDMFGPAADVFVVSRLPEPSQYPAPLGSLATLLMEAIERATKKDAPAPVPPAEPVAQGSRVGPLPVAAVAPAQARATSQTTPPLKAAKPMSARNAHGSSPPVSQAGATTRRHEKPTQSPHGRGVAVAVCSPKGGVGKTTITLNLALAVAQRGRRTIVIDADINGDLMSLLAARDTVPRGAYDILDHPDCFDEVLRETAIAGLKILPASGAGLPMAAIERRSRAAEWAAVITKARERAELVLIDCPAGMFDATADVLPSCTHVVGVLQSEMIGMRSSEMLERGLEAIPPESRPALAGVVVNMFQGKSAASVEAFHRIASTPPGRHLFETTIPRSDIFAAASLAGVPVRFAENDGVANPIAWLFEALATEVCGRTGLVEPATPAPSRFMR